VNRDSLKMILAFLGTILVVYGFPRLGLPTVVVQGVFLLLLANIYNGKDDLLWLVWFFMISDAPGRLFTGLYQSDIYGIPGYGIIPGITLSYSDLLLLTLLVKNSRKRRERAFLFGREVWLLIGLGVFYFAISLAMGISAANMVRAFRFVFNWLWPLVAARIITQPEDLDRLFRLLLPVVLIGFMLIIHTYVTGNYFHNILSGISRFRAIDASEESLGRVLFSSSIMSVTLVVSICLLFRRVTTISPNLLVTGSFVSGLSIFLSATRGWILFLVLVLASFFFMRGFGFLKQMVRVVVIVSLLIVLIGGAFPLVFSQSSLAFGRMLTLQEFAEGDISAGGTLSRVTYRGPRVMSMWRESPVIGWAFSNTFMQYMDPHVGNQTNLLNLGVLGFILLSFAFLAILAKTWQRGRSNSLMGVGDNAHWVFILALIGFFVVHSTSTILWSLTLTSVSKYLIWAFLFSIINVALIPYTVQGKKI